MEKQKKIPFWPKHQDRKKKKEKRKERRKGEEKAFKSRVFFVHQRNTLQKRKKMKCTLLILVVICTEICIASVIK